MRTRNETESSEGTSQQLTRAVNIAVGALRVSVSEARDREKGPPSRPSAESYEVEVERLDARNAATLLLDQASRLEGGAGTSKQRKELVQKALGLDPSFAAAQHMAMRLLDGTKLRDEVEALLAQRSAAEGGRGSDELLLHYALECDMSRDVADAAWAYAQVLEQDSGNVEAAEGLLRQALRTQDWPEVARLLMHLAAFSGDGGTRSIFQVIAALLDEGAAADERAQRLAQAGLVGVHELAIPAAVGLYVAAGQHEQAIRVLAEAASRWREDAGRYFFQASWLLESMGQLERATRMAEQAYQEANDPLITSWIVDLYQRQGLHEKLIEVLRTKVAGPLSEEEAVESRLALARALVEHTEDKDGAISLLEEALAQAPTNQACLQELGRLYVETERWPRLDAMHVKEARATKDDDRRAFALYRSAQICGLRLGKEKLAIKRLREALKLRPNFSPALRLAEHLFQRAGRHQDLVDLYRDELTRCDRTARVGLLERIAVLQETQLRDTAAAIETNEELLDLAPGRVLALQALARLYGDSEQYGRLLSILRALVMTSRDTGEKVSLLLRMGQLLETEVGEHQHAAAHYREALDLRPAPQIFEAYGRLLNSRGRWQELVELSERQLESELTAEQRIGLLWRIARIAEERLDLPQKAAHAYGELLRIDECHLPALRGLVRTGHDDPELRRDGLRRLALCTNSQRGVETQLRAALTVLQQIPDEGKKILQQVVDSGSRDPLARDLLVQRLVADAEVASIPADMGEAGRLSLALGRHDLEEALDACEELQKGEETRVAGLRLRDLLASATKAAGESMEEVIQARLEAESSPALRNVLMLRQAHLAKDKEQAIDLYRELAEDPDYAPRALEKLEEFARAGDDEVLLLEVSSRRIEKAGTQAEKARLLVQRGRVHSQKKDADLAEQDWRAAVAANVRYRPAYEHLRALYQQNGDSRGLRWVLELGLESVLEPEARVADLLVRATLRSEEDELEGAWEDVREALRLSPSDTTALALLGKMADERGETSALVEALDAARKDSACPQDRASYYDVKLALLQRDHLHDPQEALTVLRQAIERTPDAFTVLLLAAETHLQLTQPTEAIAFLSRAVLRADSEEHLLDAHLCIAEIYHRMLGASEQARKSLAAALELDPKNTAALEMMAYVCEESGREEEAEQTLERWVENAGDSAERARIWSRLLELRDRVHGRDHESTVAAARELFDAAPSEGELVEFAVEVLGAADQWDEVAQRIGAIVETIEPARRPALALLRAQVLGQRLGRVDEAREVLRELVVSDPEQKKALELFVTLLPEPSVMDAGQRNEAIALVRKLLQQGGLSLSLIRQLATLCELSGRTDESYCATSAILFMGKASEEEKYFHRRRRGLVPPGLSGALSEEERASLFAVAGAHPAGALLAGLSTHLSDLFPSDLSQYGVGSLETQALDADHLTMTMSHECGCLLGVDSFRVVEALGGAISGAVEPGDPASLVLPRNFTRLPVPQQRFIVGHLLGRIATRTEAFDRGRTEPLSARDLMILAAAVVRVTEGSFGDEVASTAILDDVSSRLKALVGVEAVTAMVDDARGCFESGGEEEISAWLKGCEAASYRAGLLCGGTLDAFCTMDEQGVGVALPSRVATDLLRFSVSTEFSLLRMRAGLALIPEGGATE